GLSVSRRINPQVSQAEGLRPYARSRGISARLVYADDRRRGCASFGLAPVIAGISHLVRLGHAGFVFAREGVFAVVGTRPLPLTATTAVASARLLERPTGRAGGSGRAAALPNLGRTYVRLGQSAATRPNGVGTVTARDLESLQDKMAPFPQEEAEAGVAAALAKPLSTIYVTFGPA